MTRWATGWATRLVPIFATMLMLVGARAYVASREAARPLPVLGNLPSFRLTDQEGRAYGSDDLDGKVWVASFIDARTGELIKTVPATKVLHQLAELRAIRERNVDHHA